MDMAVMERNDTMNQTVGAKIRMEESIVNTSLSTSATITQAQIITTAVVGSVIIILVVLNLVMYSIYKKLTQLPKVSVKLTKQEGVQLYQVRATGEYNSLSHSSLNQSHDRHNTIRTISLSGDDTTSVEYSMIMQSYNPNRSTDSTSGQDVSYQLDTSKDTHIPQQWESTPSKDVHTDKTNSGLVETAAQIHEDSLPRTHKTKGISDIHLYQSFKTQLDHKKLHRNSKLDEKAAKRPPGISREAPIELHRSKTKLHQKVKGYVDMTDFDNDTDTEVSVQTIVDSVQPRTGDSQSLENPAKVFRRPVVEFQNKAFEFSETKTALEEVADTDL